MQAYKTVDGKVFGYIDSVNFKICSTNKEHMLSVAEAYGEDPATFQELRDSAAEAFSSDYLEWDVEQYEQQVSDLGDLVMITDEEAKAVYDGWFEE